MEIYATVTLLNKGTVQTCSSFAVDGITIVNICIAIRCFEQCAGRSCSKFAAAPNACPARNQRRKTVCTLWWVNIVLIIVVTYATLGVVICRCVTDFMNTRNESKSWKLRFITDWWFVNIRTGNTCQKVKIGIIHICICIGIVRLAIDNIGCRDLDSAIPYGRSTACDRLLYYLIGAGVFRHIRRHRIAPIYSNRCTSRRAWEINRTGCLRCASAKRSVLIAVDKILEGIRLGACTNHRIEINRLRYIELYSRFNGVYQLLDIDNGLWLREQNARVKDEKGRRHKHKDQ